MTAAQFCIASGASPKWIQNVARILGWSLRYTREEARHVGLVKRIHDDVQLPLVEADRLAAEVWAADGSRVPSELVTVGAGRTARITVDLARYLSDFAVRLARAAAHEPRRRGRQPRRAAGAIARAREHGWDISLLESSLRATPSERIRRLDENMELVRALRTRR